MDAMGDVLLALTILLLSLSVLTFVLALLFQKPTAPPTTLTDVKVEESLGPNPPAITRAVGKAGSGFNRLSAGPLVLVLLLFVAGLSVLAVFVNHVEITKEENNSISACSMITAKLQTALEPAELQAAQNAYAAGDWPGAYQNFPLGVAEWHPENNIIVSLPDPADASCDATLNKIGYVSDVWTVSGWTYQFIALKPGQAHVLSVGEGVVPMYKLLKGTLLNVDTHGVQREDGQWESHVVTVPNRVRSMAVPRGVSELKAGASGATLVLMTASQATLRTLLKEGDMQELTSIAHDISGPFTSDAEGGALKWAHYGSYPATQCKWCNIFKNLDWWNMAGFLVQDHTGARVGHLQFWTILEGIDADNYHDHTGMPYNASFGELHAMMYAAGATAGMTSQLPDTHNKRFHAMSDEVTYQEWGTTTKSTSIFHKWNGVATGGKVGGVDTLQAYNENVQLPLTQPPGYIHGPMWLVREDGKPVPQCVTGAPTYPNHRLTIGRKGPAHTTHHVPRYNMWVAFEHPPEHVTVPPTMLTFLTNQKIQSTMTTELCEKDYNMVDEHMSIQDDGANVTLFEECDEFCVDFINICPLPELFYQGMDSWNDNGARTIKPPGYRDCMKECVTWARTPIDQLADDINLKGDTFLCRKKHLSFAAYDGSAAAAFHCYHASPGGDGICTDSKIDVKGDGVLVTPFKAMVEGKATVSRNEDAGHCDLYADYGSGYTIADCSAHDDGVNDATDSSLAVILQLLPETTQILFLRGNKGITSIGTGLLANLRKPLVLKALYLDGCRISTVSSNAFDSVSNLEILNLDLNLISTLPDTLLQPLAKLKSFGISNNALTYPGSFTDQLFANNVQLESVIMYGNAGIVALPAGLFTGLSKVETISFVSCALTNAGIPDALFDSLVNLKRFDFFQNRLDKIMPRWFQSTPKIERIVLWKNPLGTGFSSDNVDPVPSNSFSNLPELTQIYLHQASVADPKSEINVLPKTLFENNPKLQVVTLSNSNAKGTAFPHTEWPQVVSAWKAHKIGAYPTNYKVAVFW